VSVPAFDQLFKEHSGSLDLGNLLSSTIMFTTDLGRIGYNEQASVFAKAVLDATSQHLDSRKLITTSNPPRQAKMTNPA
ncbi:MAG: hypothetical protein K2O12_03325, partial [Muribaculaceae bacterium]|nr:hypothetical protein [Muribaculaceae bacterium]